MTDEVLVAIGEELIVATWLKHGIQIEKNSLSFFPRQLAFKLGRDVMPRLGDEFASNLPDAFKSNLQEVALPTLEQVQINTLPIGTLTTLTVELGDLFYHRGFFLFRRKKALQLLAAALGEVLKDFGIKSEAPGEINWVDFREEKNKKIFKKIF